MAEQTLKSIAGKILLMKKQMQDKHEGIRLIIWDDSGEDSTIVDIAELTTEWCYIKTGIGIAAPVRNLIMPHLDKRIAIEYVHKEYGGH